MIAGTIDGCPINMAEAVWHVRTPTAKLRFDFELPDASDTMRDALRAAVGRILMRKRPELAYEALKRCRVLVRHANARTGRIVDALDVTDLNSYRHALDVSQLYLAASALDCLKLLVKVGFEGVTRDFRRELPTLVVAQPAIASPANLACPHRGPLTSGELAVILRELTGAYHRGQVPLANFALAFLMIMLVPRPGQAALLKIGDMNVTHGPSGPQYTLAMPLIKLPRAGMLPTRNRPRPLHESLGAALARQCEEASHNEAVQSIPRSQRPIFPACTAKGREVDWPELPHTVGHATASYLSALAIRTFAKLDLSSMRVKDEERTVTATRLRRSLATLARGDGASGAQIGEMLWHTGASAAHIYAGPSVGTIERVEAAIEFAPLSDLYRRELEAVEAERVMLPR